jgi:hypothetical protein
MNFLKVFIDKSLTVQYKAEFGYVGGVSNHDHLGEVCVL